MIDAAGEATGMVHIYYGNGKGKTTAAMGLALRALGHGWHVDIVQFLKDGTSGELAPLRALGATVRAVDMGGKFSFHMDEDELAAVRAAQTANLEALSAASKDAASTLPPTGADIAGSLSSRGEASAAAPAHRLVVLDEALDAVATGTLDEARLLEVLKRLEAAGAEVVLTGRKPSPELAARADYQTEMVARSHPFDRGVAGREGVEW